MPARSASAGATTWSLSQWARAIVALPVSGPLPSRVVVVPRLRVSHALKRELVAGGQAPALVGTHFVTAALAAREVLALAGEPVTEGEETLRPIRLALAFEGALPLKHFELPVLREARGWDDALASTANELEAAGLSAAALRGRNDARLDDLAALRELLDAEAKDSVTHSGLLARATAALSRGAAWPWRGHTLAVVTGHESAAHAAFLAAVPRAQVRLLGARPSRTRWKKRVEALYGPAPAAAVDEPPAPPAGATELGLLQRFLFSDPQTLADAARPRSKGPDGSVDFEEHAGVEAELEATADWVVRQVKAGRALGRLAVLVPHADPLVSMVRARLQRIPWGKEPLPVFVAGGEPALGTGTGARLLSLLHALASFLSADAFTALLPALRLADGPAAHLDVDDAIGLVASLGTLGGAAEHREGARDWLPAARKMRASLAQRIAAIEGARGTGEEEAESRNLWALERTHGQLTQLLPALEALDGLAQLVVDDAPLANVWARLDDFLSPSGHLRLPPESQDVALGLQSAVRAICADGRVRQARGLSALSVIDSTLRGLRRAVGRYGQPAVYVGTVRGAVGLGFDAVRVIGLAEGSIPPALREDAVLGAAARDALGVPALETRETRGLLDLQSLHRVVLETRAHLALSYPRADLSGSVHETSSVFIEAAAALGRPNAATGQPSGVVPRVSDLARDAFVPARAAQRAARTGQPIGDAAWLDRVASAREDVPRAWAQARAMDPSRVEDVLAEERGALDGYLGDAAAAVTVRGTVPAQPVSASRLRTLLVCPHRFLLESVIGWEEPASPQPTGELDPLTYGTLVHRVLERFARERGKALAASPREQWQKEAAALAEEELARLLEGYALLGEGVREHELRRVLRDVETFIDAEWAARKGRKYVDVERAFGTPDALKLELEGGSLFVHGFIDRLDTERGRTLVRDYKTGRAHPRAGSEAAPLPELDTQIALYGMVAKQLAKQWKLPARVAMAYAYPSPEDPLRAFVDDAEELEATARGWLEVARQLLTSRTFPRTVDATPCGYCPFKVVCGAEGPIRSDALLREPVEVDAGLARLWKLVLDVDEGEAGE